MVSVDTPESLREAGKRLFGSERGWQRRFAEALEVDDASISRWLAGSAPIPGPVKVATACLLRESGRGACA